MVSGFISAILTSRSSETRYDIGACAAMGRGSKTFGVDAAKFPVMVAPETLLPLLCEKVMLLEGPETLLLSPKKPLEWLLAIAMVLPTLWPKNRAGRGGTGGTSSRMAMGPDLGVPKLHSSIAAARPAASSSRTPLVSAVDGLVSVLEWRK